MKRRWLLPMLIAGLALLLWLFLARPQEKANRSVNPTALSDSLPSPRIYIQ